ncbi:uncharacterized protein LOC114040019 [Vombatus ursinus]|uniref:uncharacterized protein LOC114040019 n=1 Tax=Vombatus ursinus TaxID=29139 RepID=UPI000FFD0BB3|nr:uncharacterized protein LOC114040019 [Vombatus ursinus]
MVPACSSLAAGSERLDGLASSGFDPGKMGSGSWLATETASRKPPQAEPRQAKVSPLAPAQVEEEEKGKREGGKKEAGTRALKKQPRTLSTQRPSALASGCRGSALQRPLLGKAKGLGMREWRFERGGRTRSPKLSTLALQLLPKQFLEGVPARSERLLIPLARSLSVSAALSCKGDGADQDVQMRKMTNIKTSEQIGGAPLNSKIQWLMLSEQRPPHLRIIQTHCASVNNGKQSLRQKDQTLFPGRRSNYIFGRKRAHNTWWEMEPYSE